MKTLFGRLRRVFLGIAADEVRFSRRGFRGATPEMRMRLEEVGAAFLDGYHKALEHVTLDSVCAGLAETPLELRGFGFEGAAMGLALLDWMCPWGYQRVNRFFEKPANSHIYMVHVGVGWLGARLPFGFRRIQARLDPLLRWLAFDGWGFHEGFFHWLKYSANEPAPRALRGYERRVFDQGLGRSFWFVNGGNVELVASTISRFSTGRQADLWSGIGLAATYAGIISETSLADLRERAGRFQPQLAQGAAFAAKARLRAGNLTDYSNLATQALCGLSAASAARITDAALENLSAAADVPAYEIWRQRIQNHFAAKSQPQPAL